MSTDDVGRRDAGGEKRHCKGIENVCVDEPMGQSNQHDEEVADDIGHEAKDRHNIAAIDHDAFERDGCHLGHQGQYSRFHCRHTCEGNGYAHDVLEDSKDPIVLMDLVRSVLEQRL